MLPRIRPMRLRLATQPFDNPDFCLNWNTTDDETRSSEIFLPPTRHRTEGFLKRVDVLVHGNRILSAAVFSKFESNKLFQPIGSFSKSVDASVVAALCESAYPKMVNTIQTQFDGKVLAVLFQESNPEQTSF